MWLNRGVFHWFVAVGHVFCHEDMEVFLGSGFSENSDLVSHSACHDLPVDVPLNQSIDVSNHSLHRSPYTVRKLKKELGEFGSRRWWGVFAKK